MSRKTFAVTQKNLELRSAALAANSADLPHMEVPRQKVDAMLTELKDLTTQQASLTASKQEISKRLAALNNEGQRMITFLDVGVRQHYGTQSEKLVEFGQQPFRPQPRLRLVGLDGKPVKPGTIPVQPPTPTPPHP
ncbi:MAG TPA: hypothetical protein VH988_00640 [Thermoanaerobaculia bacterium]|jgi:hypothetical protein|nr:hypothetical protein [Thermoanaerobaculia bacterium]